MAWPACSTHSSGWMLVIRPLSQLKPTAQSRYCRAPNRPYAAPGAPAGLHGWPPGAVSKHDALQRVSPAQTSAVVPHADLLRLAAAAYLARFKGVRESLRQRAAHAGPIADDTLL